MRELNGSGCRGSVAMRTRKTKRNIKDAESVGGGTPALLPLLLLI